MGIGNAGSLRKLLQGMLQLSTDYTAALLVQGGKLSRSSCAPHLFAGCVSGCGLLSNNSCLPFSCGPIKCQLQPTVQKAFVVRGYALAMSQEWFACLHRMTTEWPCHSIGVSAGKWGRVSQIVLARSQAGGASSAKQDSQLS